MPTPFFFWSAAILCPLSLYGCPSPVFLPCARTPPAPRSVLPTSQQVGKLASARQHHVPGSGGTREPSPPVTRSPLSLLLRSPALTALCSECTMQSLQTAITPRNAVSSSQQETPCCFSSFCYPPPPAIAHQGSTPPCTPPSPCVRRLHSPCIRPSLQHRNPYPALAPPVPHPPCPANFPTFQLSNKSESRQVGKRTRTL